MTSYSTLRAKMFKALREWPESRQNEIFPGTQMTYLEVATRFQKTKNRKNLWPLLEVAIESGFIRTSHKEVKKHD